MQIRNKKQQAIMLLQGGQLPAAKILLEQICQVVHGDWEVWNLRAAVHGMLEEYAEAEQCCKAAIHLQPRAVGIYNNLANALRFQGKYQEAEAYYREALRIMPAYAEAFNNLGNLQREQGNLEEAESSYREALRIQPQYPGALNNLGNVFMDQDRFPEAEKCYTQALKLSPDLIDCHLNLGKIEEQRCEYDKAKLSYTHAFNLQPSNTNARTCLAALLERAGDYDNARELVYPIIHAGIQDPDATIVYASISRHYGEQREAVRHLESISGMSCHSVRKKQDIHYAAGKLYDSIGDYDLAFQHYALANALASDKYDAVKQEHEFKSLVDVFSRVASEQRARANNQSNLPIFIIGMPRSGTSLVEQILACHPDVYGAGELEDVDNVVSMLQSVAKGRESYPWFVDSLCRDDLNIVAGKHLDGLARFSRKAARVTDKMPHNFRHLGFIDLLFPGARVIHCSRDPIDTCLSIYFQHFNRNHPYSSSLENLGHYYTQYERLMSHWKAVLKVPIYDLKYEMLVNSPESCVRELLEFCGLDWDEKCLDFHRSQRIAATPSYDQVRRPLYKNSIGRWKNYERFLDPLFSSFGIPDKKVDSALPRTRKYIAKIDESAGQ